MDKDIKDVKIAVAGTGYVGLSIATLLSQHHPVMAVDVVKEKVELINNKAFAYSRRLYRTVFEREGLKPHRHDGCRDGL